MGYGHRQFENIFPAPVKLFFLRSISAELRPNFCFCSRAMRIFKV